MALLNVLNSLLMFEITQPTSTSSTQSRSLAVATKPPKSDVGVIRSRPSVSSYKLALEVSNEGNDEWVSNITVTVNSVSPEEGPEVILITKEALIEDLGPNATKEVTFELGLANPEHYPREGDRYRIVGDIKFYNNGSTEPFHHQIDFSVEVEESE